jgi:dihydroorotase
VTAEVTPHHLLLTDELARSYSPLFKVNPPLRTSEDVDAVRNGLVDGTIDIVATDHAPHASGTKDCTWAEAAFGMVGLESALPIMNTTLVESGLMSWNDIARIASETPARIGGLTEYETPLAVGSVANITLIDPSDSSPWSPSHWQEKAPTPRSRTWFCRVVSFRRCIAGFTPLSMVASCRPKS